MQLFKTKLIGKKANITPRTRKFYLKDGSRGVPGMPMRYVLVFFLIFSVKFVEPFFFRKKLEKRASKIIS